MIPISDNVAHRRVPIVAVSLILINVVIFFYEIRLGPDVRGVFDSYAFIPENIAASWLNLRDRFLPLFTSMFLHGGWAHLIGNMWYMWIFADNVEDVFGHFTFLVFYVICGIAASLTHFFLNQGSSVPTVGASGAIAGVLGAYVVMFPDARISTWFPNWVYTLLSGRLLTFKIPAFYFLGFWFAFQFFMGLLEQGASTVSGIAFWAHVGGFAAGVLCALFLGGGHDSRQD